MSYSHYAFTFVGYCTDGDYICYAENGKDLEIGDKTIEDFEGWSTEPYQMDGHEFFIDWDEDQGWCVGILLFNNDEGIYSCTTDEMLENFQKAKAVLDYLGIPAEPKLYTFARYIM